MRLNRDSCGIEDVCEARSHASADGLTNRVVRREAFTPTIGSRVTGVISKAETEERR
jgi:hypothetical protein